MTTVEGDRHVWGLADLGGPGIDLLIVGINPGALSARVGHYYAGPGNLFWRCLHEAGLTDRRLQPEEDRLLPSYGIGLTDCARRPTRSAGHLAAGDFREGAERLRALARDWQPLLVCFNGIVGYRRLYDPFAAFGMQETLLEGARVVVAPSTSAANAGFTREERVAWFRYARGVRDALRAGDALPPPIRREGGGYTYP